MYDRDKNQWIDENDPIYEKLRIWDQNEDDILVKLSDYGIGAIHLGSVDTSFQLRNSNGETSAQLSSTGIALTETGEVRTVQQIDLFV